MKFTLPEVHSINVEIDGRSFDGAWCVILGDMVVYYNGHSASTGKRESDASDVARTMLSKLVEQHHTRLESISTNLPQTIRLAAHHYVNATDDELAVEDLVASFGDSIAGTLAHKQLSWLCVNSISMIVPAWKHLCDGNAAEQTLNDLRKWLGDPRHAVDWATAMTPAVGCRDGVPVSDCDTCRLQPTADAVASAARYLQSADPADAKAALLSASSAYDEGCHSGNAPERFEKWLVFDALQAALECRPIGGSVSQ